jgi:hypothetical protein
VENDSKRYGHLNVGLDEFTEENLLAEIRMRKAMRDAGHCDYCNRPNTEPTCRFLSRHNYGKEVVHSIKEIG